MSFRLEKNSIYHTNFVFHIGDKIIKQVDNATETYIFWDGKYLYKSMVLDLSPNTIWVVIQDNKQLEKYPKETDEEGKKYIIIDETLKRNNGVSLTLSNVTFHDKYSSK